MCVATWVLRIRNLIRADSRAPIVESGARSCRLQKDELIDL